MAQIIVRKIEESVKAQLQKRAKRHGRSMEEEVREILRSAAKSDPEANVKLGSRIASLFVDLEPIPIREWHGIKPRPAKFGK